MMIDPVYWYFALPGLIVTIIAQIYVKIMFSRYSKKDSGRDITGKQAAEIISDGEDFPVNISVSQPPLGDHFDPTSDTVRISVRNTESNSVADVAVVAHEFGHVQQKFTSSLVYKIRSIMVPVTNVGTQIGYILFFIGLGISMLRLSEIGLILFSTSVIFALITLPVEIDASKRGMKLIEKYDLIEKKKRGGASKVLTAAALTYVAGLLTSILNLLYYINIFNRNKED